MSSRNQDKQIIIDLLPPHILDEIVASAGVENLGELVLDETFAQLNPNLKIAIDQALGETGKLIYSNKKSSPADHEKNAGFHVSSIETLFQLLQYCNKQHKSVELVLSFTFESLLDFVEFNKFLDEFVPKKSIKLTLMLVYKRCFPHGIDLDALQNEILKVKGCLVSYGIHAILIEKRGELDLLLFSQVEELDLEYCQVKGLFEECKKLKKLSFTPNSNNQAKLFDLTQLPMTVKSLTLGDCEAFKQLGRRGIGRTLPKLEEMSFCCGYATDFPWVISDALWFMASPETRKLELWCYKVDCGYFEQFVQSGLGENLETLVYQGYIEHFIRNLPSHRLEIHDTDIYDHFTNLRYPSTLKILKLVHNGFSTLSGLLSCIPLGLEELDVSYNYLIDWDGSNSNFSRFKELKKLNLRGCDVKGIERFQFPESLEDLNLLGHELSSIDDLAFLPNLLALNFSSHRLKHVCNPPLPHVLKKLELLCRNIETLDLSRNRDGKPFVIEHLEVGLSERSAANDEVSKTEFQWSKLPHVVRQLFLENCCPTGSVQFEKDLEVLSMVNCDLSKVTGLSFVPNSTLRKLTLSNCELTSLEFELPQLVEEVDLSRNKLSKIPEQLAGLEHLQVLNLSENEIGDEVEFRFEHKSLQVLDLSSNKLKSIQLSFPEGTTKLKIVDLSENQLKNISMSSIGHSGRTQHNTLYSLALTANKKIGGEQIDLLKSLSPPSMKCLWLNKVAATSKFLPDYHTINELDGSMLFSKKLPKRPDNFWKQFSSIDWDEVVPKDTQVYEESSEEEEEEEEEDEDFGWSDDGEGDLVEVEVDLDNISDVEQ